MRAAAWAMLPALLGAAGVGVHEERRVELTGWQAGERWVLRFPPPAVDYRVHVRLSLGGGTGPRLNGTLLAPLPGRPGVYDAGDFLARGENVLEVTGDKPPSEARLLITPRVFVDGQVIEVEGGLLRATTTVRNTLENTVNVTLLVAVVEEGTGKEVGSFAADATVPPGTSMDVPAGGPMDVGGAERLRAVTTMEKAEEAMEGAYRFRIAAPVVTTR